MFKNVKSSVMLLIGIAAAIPGTARAQTWNDARTRALVELATRRRAEQLADTGLVDYRATAHGYVTFLAQMGEGFPEPPKVVKADELGLEVYWHAPNLSKQVIQGRRDTLLLPTDIQYHRDHLGIVQNNFPNVIRLGEGDEVRDVPHPLSPEGLQTYDFAITDSLRIRLPGRAVNVYEVKVRPRNDRQARVVGAVYIDQDEGQVVRMAFSFTRAAFLDAELEDVSIVLENGLVGTRFWLPRRQEIEIRRTGTWLQYPVRGIIRGRWEIGDYRINTKLPLSLFAGPEIVQLPPQAQKQYHFPALRILDSLPPDVRAVTDADVQRVQAEARALVRAQALQRAQSATLSARGASDFVRVNRVEGMALGAGFAQRLGAGTTVDGRARYGLADHDAKWRASLGKRWEGGAAIRVFGYRDFRDVGEEPERSTAVNSLAAQEFGSDYTDPYRVAGGGVGFDYEPIGGLAWHAEASLESPRTLDVRLTPVSGRFRPTLVTAGNRDIRVDLRAEQPTILAWAGTELRVSAGVRALWLVQDCTPLVAAGQAGDGEVLHAICGGRQPPAVHASMVANLERPFGSHRLVTHTIAAVVRGREDVAQELLYFGGPVSGPGYDFHQLVATSGISQRLEWRTPVPFVGIPLGRFGRVPPQATLAPYAHLIAVRSASAPVRPGDGRPPVPGLYPSLGIGLLTFFDMLRLDVAHGLRAGRWTFSVDVNPAFWSVL